MRNNDGFMAGVIAGVALGALMVAAFTPQVRQPMMEGAGQLGNRMRKMWNRGGDMMEDMMPGDAT